MFGREDRIGFSMLSRKLPDLSIEAATWDPRCPVYKGLSGLVEDTSNLVDAAIALISPHLLNKKYRAESVALHRCGTTAHKGQI